MNLKLKNRKEDIMEQIITFLVIAGIWGYCAVTQTAEKKRKKAYYQSKLNEHAAKGEKEQANMYIELLTRLK